MDKRDALLGQVCADLWNYMHRPATAQFSSTAQIREILAPFLVAWDAARPYPIPGPYEIALQVGAAAVQSGRFENIGAALHAAWVAVPEFYKGRDLYVTTIAPLIYGVSPPEGTPAYDQADDAPA